MSEQHKEHEHITSEALSVKLESSAAARNWIIRGVVIFLVLVFFGGLALGANDLLTRESPMPPEAELDETITNPPGGSAEIYAYIQSSIEIARAEKPKLSYDTSFDLGGDYLDSMIFTAGGADQGVLEQLKATARLLAPGVSGKLHDSSPAEETQYGDDFSQLLWQLNFDPAQIENAECDFVYFRCTACGRGEKEPQETCPGCGAKGTEERPIFVIAYQDNYTFTLTFADDSTAIDENFHPRTVEAMESILSGELEGAAVIRGMERDYKNASIVAAVNRTTKKLQSLQFVKDIDAWLDLDINPQLAQVGQAAFNLSLKETTNFKFTWPAVTLSAHERTMNTRENSQLTARIDAPDGQETPITWVSSAPTICAIDQDGYLKSGKETGEAVITVTFELDGEAYSDECAVHVKVPVENIKLDRRTLKLDKGETKQLKATVSPRKATYKSVTWHTGDPAVAVVDENGLITAVAPGTVKVYALAVDGWFRSSCTVIVAGGEG